MCRGIPMCLVQQDYDVQWLGINHQFNCHTNATSIVIEQCKKDLIERISTIVISQENYSNIAMV